MKKTYTYEVWRQVQWSKYRCPNCGNGWIETWHLIDNGGEGDRTQSYDPYPFNAEWQMKCPMCGTATVTFHKRKHMKKAWKDMCKNYEDYKEMFDKLAKE